MSFDPMSAFLISSAFSAASAATGYVAESQTASTQAAMNRRAAEEARLAALADYEAFDAMDREMAQDAGSEMVQHSKEAMRLAATTRTAAGEAGVGGLSVNALLADIHGQAAQLREGVTTNVQRTRDQLHRERSGAHATHRSRLNSLPPVQRPSLVATGLNAGAGIFGAYRDHLMVPGVKSRAPG